MEDLTKLFSESVKIYPNAHLRLMLLFWMFVSGQKTRCKLFSGKEQAIILKSHKNSDFQGFIQSNESIDFPRFQSFKMWTPTLFRRIVCSIWTKPNEQPGIGFGRKYVQIAILSRFRQTSFQAHNIQKSFPPRPRHLSTSQKSAILGGKRQNYRI